MADRDQDLVLMLARMRENIGELLADHQPFHKALDGTDAVKFSGLGSSPAEYRIEAHEALLWRDPIAYMDEYLQWQGRAHQEEHKSAIDFLKQTNQLAVFRDLSVAIRRGRVAPFVGAGSSACLRFPMWADALNQLANVIESATPRKRHLCVQARGEIIAGRMVEAGAILYGADRVQVDQFVLSNYSVNPDLTLKDVSGPVLCLPEIASGCVITTNFDNLIEKVFAESGKPIDGYMHGSQTENNFAVNLIKGDRCILKLHGDSANTATYVFSTQQYDRAYGNPLDFNKPLARALRQIYVSHTLLFVGCSLEQDRTLDLFRTVVHSKLFDIPIHYALIEKKGTSAQFASKLRRLDQLSIRPIWVQKADFPMIDRLLSLALAVSKKRVSV